MSRVLGVLKEYDRITGGVIRVTGDQIQFVGNDGSLFYIDFDTQILNLLKGGSTSVTIRSR
jgi:hypothetical protein